MDKKLFIIPIVIIIIIGTIMYFTNISFYKMELHFYKDNNNCLIEYEDKKVLINISDTIESYLDINKINKIDYLIINDIDNINTDLLTNIINKYQIDKLYLPNTIEGLDNIEQIIVNNPKNIKINKLDINIDNINSLIISMKYMNKSYLYINNMTEDDLDNYLNRSKYDVLILNNTFDKKVIDKFKPKNVIITSVNKDKDFTKYLDDKKIDYYFTNNGNIDIFSGVNIKIYQ